MDISLYNHVAKNTYPHTLWKNLEGMYETKNVQAKIFFDEEVDEFKTKGWTINCRASE